MKLFTNKPKIKFIKNLDVSRMLNCSEAQLVHIQGIGKLKTLINTNSDDYYGSMNHIQITLDDVPLFYAHSPECPTCASLIATGYGIESTNCTELETISNKINNPFVSLENSIYDLEPLLSLLESGLYIIADMLCYPTDGNKNFFWNTPNNYTENPATSRVWLNDSDFEYEFIEGDPIYLFPTQSTDKYNHKRVEEYISIFKSNSQRPRAVAYHYYQFLNFLLDGHHKACASNLIGEPVNTLVIIPLTYTYTTYTDSKPQQKHYKFADFVIPELEIPHQYRIQSNFKKASFRVKNEKHIVNMGKWEDIYLNNTKHFPSVEDFAMIKASGVYEVSDELIQQWIKSNNKSDKRKLRSLIALWKITNNPELKKLALICAHTKEYSLLKEDAFRALSQLRNDLEIETFFIEYLVEDEDTHSLLRMIADSYWDNL